MVVASPTPNCDEKILPLSIPVIDMSWRRDLVLELMVKACDEFGFFKVRLVRSLAFFKVINHGVSKDVIAKMENAGKEFFSLPIDEKKKAGPPNPLGYGSRNIGFNGDMGELEYLLLPTSANSISQRIGRFCKETSNFSVAVHEYVDAVRQLACEILEMLGEGLGLRDRLVFSRLLRDNESDSLIRLNHYPPFSNNASNKDGKGNNSRIGFGEHSDPQIISILRSNDVEGLQILVSSTDSDAWVPVVPDPSAFFINVGDTLEALTNGRFVSVRHRAMANSYTSRLSTIYFGAPPLNAWISPLPEMFTPSKPRQYKSFTWAEYKKTMYSLRLSHDRLGLFRMDDDEDSTDTITWL